MKRTIYILVFAFILSFGLGACNSKLPNDLPSLINLMASDDVEIHTAAATKVQDFYGVEGLLAALSNSQKEAKIQAARFLRLNPSPKARLPLLEATRSTDALVRGWAAFALSSVPNSEVEKRLGDLIRNDPAPVVQNFAREALTLIVEEKKKK